MTSKFLLTATVFAIGATAATLPAAADRYDRTDARQANQAKRIEQGIRSGELTRYEAAKLKGQQEHIRALERSAERDGHVSRAERARLQAAQNAASRSIYAEKHDRDDRNWGHSKRRWWKWSNHHRGDHPRPWYRRWY